MTVVLVSLSINTRYFTKRRLFAEFAMASDMDQFVISRRKGLDIAYVASVVIIILMSQQLAEAGIFHRKGQQDSSISEMLAAGLVVQMLSENDGKHTVIHHVVHIPVFIPVHRH
ncbi:hypothetical protein NPIL_80031 [Nephila pilipes]|uniref:Uncharacterized protein n=1 Tax=Nephila pilipes TaxID=299642 RepID=A0A8X6Q7F5_NEPPI|nr:hypothetical protein NPIL_80031 [Nephila pilipes]